MKGIVATSALGFLLAAGIFLPTSLVATSSANAVACARGVYRAGCVGPHGAVAVRRAPVAVGCRWVWVNGRRVCRVIR